MLFRSPLMNVAPSLYIIGASLLPSNKAATAEKIILREVEKLANIPPSRAEMERALNQLEFAFYSEINTNSGIANFLGEGETDLGRFEREFEFRDALRNVKPEQVRDAAARWLQAQKRVVITATPKAAAHP